MSNATMPLGQSTLSASPATGTGAPPVCAPRPAAEPQMPASDAAAPPTPPGPRHGQRRPDTHRLDLIAADIGPNANDADDARVTNGAADAGGAGHAADAGGAGDAGDTGGVSIMELIERLHARELAVADVPAKLRQHCIDHLTHEGFTNGEIARIIGIHERTVRRDRQAFRRDHAVQPQLALGDELVGEFERIILHSVQRLIRLCRDGDVPPYARLWAEEAIARNYQRLIDTTRRLNYFDDGGNRLKHLRYIDPTANARQLEKWAAEAECNKVLGPIRKRRREASKAAELNAYRESQIQQRKIMKIQFNPFKETEAK